ncbi:MAG: exopolyphosphatase, partial [Actinomycetota bacterium]
MTTGRVAAIDVGTNTVRLLLADPPEPGDARALRQLDRDMVIARLGEGVDAGRVLQAAAIQRTVEAIATFVRRAQDGGATRIVIAGTSAVRDAANRAELSGAVLLATGVALEVLDGVAEARLAFSGAASGTDVAGGAVVC